MDLIVTSLYALATGGLFLYGAAQRHLRRKVLRDIETATTKSQNLLADKAEQQEAELAQTTARLRTVQGEFSTLQAQVDALNIRRESLIEFLNTADGKSSLARTFEEVKKAEARLAELQEQIKAADIRMADVALYGHDIGRPKPNTYLCSMTFTKDDAIGPLINRVILPEASAMWARHPGTKLQVAVYISQGGEGSALWEGSTEAGLKNAVSQNWNKFIDTNSGRMYLVTT
jgi:hypothetical protein